MRILKFAYFKFANVVKFGFYLKCHGFCHMLSLWKPRWPLHDCKSLGLLPLGLIFFSCIWTILNDDVQFLSDIEETFIIIDTGFLHDIHQQEDYCHPKDNLCTEWMNQLLYLSMIFCDTLVNFWIPVPILFYRPSHTKLCTDPVSSTGDFGSVAKWYEEEYQYGASHIGCIFRMCVHQKILKQLFELRYNAFGHLYIK